MNNLDFDPNQLSQEALNLLDQGDFNGSLEIFKKLNSYFPNNPDLLNLMGYANLQLESFDEALDAYENSLSINPNQLEVLFNKAIVNDKLDNKKQALSDYDEVLKLDPNNADVFINKALIYEDLRDYELSLLEINKALKLNPDNFQAISNRAKTYEYLQKFHEAEIDLNLALELEPNNPYAYINKGNFLKKIQKLSESKEYFYKALDLSPNLDSANYNLALILLYEKNFSDGWKKYESRYHLSGQPNLTKKIPKLESFKDNQKILIWADQGIGDQVFYGSILQSLDSNIDITVLIDPRLISIFKRSFPHFKFIDSFHSSNKQMFTHQLSIISLGGFFRSHVSTFNKLREFFLKTNEANDLSIKSKINNNGKLICGLSWRSLNKKSGNKKSLELESLLPIMRMPNIHFVDIQYDDTSEEIKKFNQKYGIDIQTLNGLDKFNDIESILSLVKCCDFIISIGNATAHFAGSIAKKTYLILPHGMDAVWYWHNDNQSIWYPSIEIFRQQKINDWRAPINKIMEKVEKDFF